MSTWRRRGRVSGAAFLARSPRIVVLRLEAKAFASDCRCRRSADRGTKPALGRRGLAFRRAPAAPPRPQALPIQAQSGPMPQAPRQESGGTALKTADPAALARGREEREAIETAIVFGSPSSLAKARDQASRSVALRREDAAALADLALAISSLIYPEASDGAVVLSPRGVSDPGQGGSGADQGLLRALAAVAAGKPPEIPAEAAGSPIGELIPALLLLTVDTNDSARLALDALDRFARLGVPSIVPSLIRGVDAERRGDAQGALGLYRSALAIAPDAWSAILGTGRALLALKRSSDALAALGPLAAAHSGLSAFDRCYALALYANGRYSEAEPFVARVLTRDPQDSRFILIRARLLIRAKAYAQALPLLDAYGTVDPSNRLYLLLRSLESEGLRVRDEALKWARQGLSSYPDDPELLAIAARLLFAGPPFGHEEARTLAARAAELSPPGAAAPAESESESGAVILADRNAAGVEASRLLAIDAATRFKWADASVYLARAGAAFDDKATAAKILRKSGNVKAALDFASAWYKAEPKSDSAAEAYLRALIDFGDEKSRPGSHSPPLAGYNLLATALRSVFPPIEAPEVRRGRVDAASLGVGRKRGQPRGSGRSLGHTTEEEDYAKARFYLKQAIATDPNDPELEARQKQLDALAQQ